MLGSDDAVNEGDFSHVWHSLEEDAIRELILGGTRPDGRDSKSLRAIDCEVDLLPRVHDQLFSKR